MKFFIIFVYLSFLTLCHCDEPLEVMNEDELIQLLTEEKYVIALLSKEEECKGRCSDLEDTLVSVREELVEDTGAWVIRSFSPQYFTKYGLKDSSIVFVRSGAPLLYTGPSDNEEILLRYLLANKVSSVHILNDKTFEHQTQVATGATTGDWLVLFIKDNCEACDQIRPTVEAVAANLKGTKNVALINRDNDAGVTSRRFGVKNFPSFVFFRLGRMYKYDLPVQDVGALTAFAKDGFHNAQKLSIPTPKSPFDDVVEAAVDWLRENPTTFFMTVGGIALAIIILIALNRPPPESWATKKKKK